MPRLLLAILFIVLATPPAQAQAHPVGPTELEAIQIADRWAAQEAPGHINHCANGRRVITRSTADILAEYPDTDQVRILGYADGWFWTGTEFAWDYTRCTWTTRESLSAENQCAVDAHELMHFVIGPDHVGPLDPNHLGPVECFTHNDSTVRKGERRTKKQIARSIRYRKAQARIKARAAMRRMH